MRHRGRLYVSHVHIRFLRSEAVSWILSALRKASEVSTHHVHVVAKPVVVVENGVVDNGDEGCLNELSPICFADVLEEMNLN